MVKTQADGEDNQNADHLGPWIKAMDPGASVEVEENVHGKRFSARCNRVNLKCKMSFNLKFNFEFVSLHF
jgi:hypothetical protein